jgi:hypothetical protein
LTHTFDHERGYREMIGDVPLLTKPREVVSVGQEEVVIPEYTLYIPINFWFNRNYGLALPLIALQYHEVRLYFSFEHVEKLIIWSGTQAPNTRAFSMKEASILVDYIYLDSEERRRFAQVGHEYLIEQLQFTGVENINGSGNEINDKYKLNFNHPCKEIIWAAKNGAFNGESSRNLQGNRGRFLTYTDDDDAWHTAALDYAAENIARGMILIDEKPSDGQTFAGPYQLVPGVDFQVINVPGLPTTITIQFLPQLVSSSHFIYIITNPLVQKQVNLANDIIAFNINVYNEFLGDDSNESSTSGSEIGDCIKGYSIDVTQHQLTLNNVSIPIPVWTDNRSTTLNNGINPFDFSVVQPNNYGLRLDGKGNPVHAANIQLNGHDRFDWQYGMYFNQVQPYHHHTRTPVDGINVYSFAIHPEEHQPSGSANLSRIDSTLLNIKWVDPLRSFDYVNNVPLFLGPDTKVYIYAFSYNILRIMSGMGGLAYSN